MTGSELVVRVEGAEVGSRELDRAIWNALEFNHSGEPSHAPTYTTSLDAALALAERVLPGVRVVIDSACKETGKPAAGFVFGQDGERINGVMNDGATLPLALCAAILKAHEAGQ